MVKDFYLLLDTQPLFTRKIVIWGIGQNTKTVTSLLDEIGISREKILLCDSNERRWGETYEVWQIISPEYMSTLVNEEDDIIIISPIASNVQDDILTKICELNLDKLDCYTAWGLKWGIYFNLNVSETGKENIEQHENPNMRNNLKVLKWLAFAPLHEERILLYQPGKVGSRSVYTSLEKANKYTLHTHSLCTLDSEVNNIKMLCEKWGGVKIISMVRDPLTQMLSGMWQNLSQIWRYSDRADFAEVQDYYFEKDFEMYEFEWFNEEIKTVFGIDVYDYPFDKEKGYTIIKQSDISVLLMTMEKMDELENVIGEFVGIKDFKLKRTNEGNTKTYRFAYAEYKKRLRFTQELLDKIYLNNPYIGHFYSNEMIKQFMVRWQKKLEGEIPEEEKNFLIDCN